MPPEKKKKKPAKSDSGSSSSEEIEDVKPKESKPAKKRPKNDDDDEEPSWHLGNKRIAKVRCFKGKVMVDIREYYEDDGELKPGKKGISLQIPQWKKLCEVLPEIEDAVKEKA